MSNLEQFIEKLKGKFDLFQSEASVSVQIVIPILQHLGWETSNPQSVVPEYRVQDRRVDYALFSPNITTAPNLIIEVKAIGKVEADLQLFEYAFLTGVVLAILTDGKVWRVYLPLGGGNFQERLVRTIDLESSEARDSASALRKFLARHNVVSGKAQESAQTVINEKKQRLQSKSKIDDAWKNLTTGDDAPIIKLIVEETSRLSGYPPSRNDVIEYLNKTLYVEDEDKPTRVISATVQSNVYWLFGQDFQLENYKDAYIHVMEALATRFGENQLDESKNFYRNESEIQSYAQHASHSILNGRYWIHTHSSTKQKFAQIRRACEVAGVVFGNKSGVLFPES